MSLQSKRKLCVAGCSVSDYTCVDRVYGDILAENIGFNYIHEAVGCGSNDRIWRRVTNLIIDKKIDKNDIIVIQYTDVTRTEFWSSNPWPSYKHTGPQEERSHDNGRILSYKIGSHEWQHYDLEKSFFKTYEKHFVSDNYAHEVFRIRNFNFQNMIINLGLTVIFMLTTRIGQMDENICYGYLKDLSYKDSTGGKIEFDLRDGDQCHFNDRGHRTTADNLKQHFINHNLI